MLRTLALALCLVAGSAGAHDQYHDWMIPDAPHVSCCHNRDCRPVRAVSDLDGNWMAGSAMCCCASPESWLRINHRETYALLMEQRKAEEAT